MNKPFSQTHYAHALRLIRDGANVSTDIADELGITVAHANEILRRLRRRGFVRWTGRCLPRTDGQPGRLCRGYEVHER